MDILQAIRNSIVEDLVKSTGRHIGYIFRFKSIIEDLEKETKNLKSELEHMQDRVERAKTDTNEIEEDVQKWLKAGEIVVADVENMEKESMEEQTCLNGWFPNWMWKYQLAKKAEKKKNIMLNFRESGKFGNISQSATLSGVTVFSPKDFISFESNQRTFNQIIEALKDNKTNVVGLYGMGGVGKTTLAKAVVNKTKEENIFNTVVMVVVSQTPNIKSIQSQIADVLNFELHEESIEGRAERLCERLKTEKKILIILDDIWAALDPTIIGIPVEHHHKDCKIFLTTRLKQVCIDMGCQLPIPLDVLNGEEGFLLLKRQVGLNEDSLTLIKLAKEVANECKGLPLAIVTIGSVLKEKTTDEWKIITQKLKMSKLMDVAIVGAEVYACLKRSYDYLKTETTMLCFLLCSLFPKDHEIDMEELLRYGLGLGWYQDIDSIQDARSELREMVDNLKASSLLVDAEEGFLKMQALVRDVALWIASKGENVFMVKAGMRLTEWPKQEDLEQYTAISLMGSKLEVLPNQLVCPKLEILLLDGSSTDVPNEYFEEMKALKVASLRSFTLSLNSLHSVTNLVTLQLIDCRLRDMSSLKMLAKLEILILHDNLLVELPEELRELSKLRMLNIAYCYKLKRIPVNVISSLSRIEELYIGQNSFKEWEVEGTSAEGSNANLSELSKLYRLTMLTVGIKVRQCLPKDFVLLKNLLKYDIRVNDKNRWKPCPESRSLTIINIEGTSLFAFKALYEKVEHLELEKIMGCYQNIVPNFDETGLNELKTLSLSFIDEVEYIIDMTQQHMPSTAFSDLVHLSLHNVNVREICNGGRPPRGFLGNLETLEVESCDRMCCLFPTLLIQRLSKLKKVNIYGCGKLQDVFQLEGLSYTKENTFLLSNLASLHLSVLPNLRNIWKGPTQQVSLQRLTIVEVASCSKLRYIFTLSLARSLLQLQQLLVTNCDNLLHIVEIEKKEINDNVAARYGNDVVLPKLRKLQLEGLKRLINFCSSENYSPLCPNLQEFILNGTPSLVAKLGATMQTARQVLSKAPPTLLKRLSLKHLHEVQCIIDTIQKDLHTWWFLRNLETIEVESCGGISCLFPTWLIERLSILTEVNIHRCGELQDVFQLEGVTEEYYPLSHLASLHLSVLPNLRNIWKGLVQQVSLQNLTIVEVASCNKLRCVFTLNLAPSLLQLQQLLVTDCDSLLHIIEIKAEDDVDAKYVMLPKLRKLQLEGLKRLINFCSSENYSPLCPNLQEFILNGTPSLVAKLGATMQTARQVLYKAPPTLLKRLSLKHLHEVQCIIDTIQKDLHTWWFLRNLETIEVESCGGISCLFPTWLIERLPILTEVNIYRCGELQDVFQLEGVTEEYYPLSHLASLHLSVLPNLRNIWKGLVQQVSLQNLTIVEVASCNKLRCVFTLNLAPSLLQLQQLLVTDCDSLLHIIEIKAEDDVDAKYVMLPKLRKLQLEGLKRLVNFCSKNYSPFCPALQELILNETPSLVVDLVANMQTTKEVPNETSLIELKRGSRKHLREVECVIDMRQQQMLPWGFLENLETLKVESCDRISCLFPHLLIQRLSKLKEVNIYHCGEIQDVFQLSELRDAKENPVLLSSLASLHLGVLPNLRNIWKGPTQHVSLQSLTVVEVACCNKLKYVITLNLARSLLQLQQLLVTDCDSLEHIVEIKAEEIQDNAVARYGNDPVFPKLRKLQLRGLPKLINFCSENYSPFYQARQELILNRTPSSVAEIGPNTQTAKEVPYKTRLIELKRPSLKYLHEVECITDTMQQDVHPWFFLGNLKSLKVESCDRMSCLHPTLLIQSLPKIKEVNIYRCGELQDVFQLEGLSFTKENRCLLSSLASLCLGVLPNLKNIWKGSTQQLSLQSLTIVEVASCNKLKYVFTLNLARSLLRLEQLLVTDCDSLEHIVKIKAEETEDNVATRDGNDVILPKLRKLQLQRLEKLINFCSENYSPTWQALQELILNKTPSLVAGLGAIVQTAKEVKEVNIYQYAELQDVFQLEGDTKEYSLLLSSLVSLRLGVLPSLRNIWKGPTQQISLQSLTVVEVASCNKLRFVFTSNLARSLLQLQQLLLTDCDRLEHIVEIEAKETEDDVATRFGNDVVLPKLRKLQLERLANLINFCSENYSPLCPALQELILNKTPSLVAELGPNLQTTNEVPDKTRLIELKRSSLKHLHKMECIIDTTQQDEPPWWFLGNLETVKVESCGGMSCLYPTLQIRSLSKLKEVNIFLCCELHDVFQLERLRFTKENAFLLSSLASLRLGILPNLKNIWKGPTRQLNLQSLTIVEVTSCDKLKYVFTLNLARSLLQLQELSVTNCDSLKHIVKIKAEETEDNIAARDGNDVVLPKLRKLQLEGLEKLINFCSENYSPTCPALQELILNMTPSLVAGLEAIMHTAKEILWILKVERSGVLCRVALAQLKNNFQNLQCLRVGHCSEVKIIFQLEQQFSLPSLKELKLYDLEDLEYLYEGPAHLLSLPNLQQLEVSNCKRLGHLLSSTLARNLRQLKAIDIRDCSELERLMIEDDEEGHELFQNLSSIYVSGCEKLKSLFLVTLARLCLQQLISLEVTKSPQLEEIFEQKDEADMTDYTEIVFPQLQRLTLEGLENLINFCPSDYRFKFPYLSSWRVQECPKITTRFSVEQNGPVHAQAEKFQIEDNEEIIIDHRSGIQAIFELERRLSVLRLKVLKLYYLEDLKSLYKGPAHLLNLPILQRLEVSDCKRLRHLLSFTLARNLPQLKAIDIRNCGEMGQLMVEDGREVCEVFPNLSSIHVSGCEKLKILFPVTPARLGLQLLRSLEITKSPQLENIFGHKDKADVTGDTEIVLPLLRRLTLEGLESLVNFCPSGYYFIFPSLSKLWVQECPKITTRFSVEQNGSVHAHAEAPLKDNSLFVLCFN